MTVRFEPNQTFAAFKLELNPNEQNQPTDHIILRIEIIWDSVVEEVIGDDNLTFYSERIAIDIHQNAS